MNTREKLQNIKTQFQRGGLSLDSTQEQRLQSELIDCCMTLDARLSAIENRGMPENVRVIDEVEQRPRVDNDVTRRGGKGQK
jgi:hypothetical protein